MLRKTRLVTNKIYDALEDGTLSYQQVAEAALGFMSEDDVAEMAHANEFFLYEEEQEDEEDDDDPDDDDSVHRGTTGEVNDHRTPGNAGYFAMFSTDGNRRVNDIFEATVALNGDLTDDQIWEYAYSRLELLSREDEFGEATDTEVRNELWNALINAGRFKSWKAVNYWFYVDWYFELERKEDRRDRFQETINAIEGK